MMEAFPPKRSLSPSFSPRKRKKKDNVDVIVHLDVDAFYVACERELRPELMGVPLAVSQYNPYGDLSDCAIDDPARILYDGRIHSKANSNKSSENIDGSSTTCSSPKKRSPNVNGSLIAVSYEARARQVRRNDRGLEAIRKCPDELVIVQVPVLNGKASLTLYRQASERLMTALADYIQVAAKEIYEQILTCASTTSTSSEKHGADGDDASVETKASIARNKKKSIGDIAVEKASVDEVYIDISVLVHKILQACQDNRIAWEALRRMLLGENSASTHTTVGGLETSKAAIATNSLSKDEIRRGSSLQVEDSMGAVAASGVAAAASKTDSQRDRDKADCGKAAEAAWWARTPFPQAWTDVELSLAVGSLVTLNARQAIESKFGNSSNDDDHNSSRNGGIYTLSGGISTNKVMAKLASGLKKPNRQTLINPSDETTLQKLFHPLPLNRIRGLGGKFGQTVCDALLGVSTVGELAKVPLVTLRQKFGDKQGRYLFNTAQGIFDDDPVTERTKPKGIGAGKTFQGQLAIRSSDHDALKRWLGNLVTEVQERMKSDTTRYAKTVVCGLSLAESSAREMQKNQRTGGSTSAQLPRNATTERVTDITVKLAKDVIRSCSSAGADANKDGSLFIVGMSVSVKDFVSIAQGSSSIVEAFKRSAELSPLSKTNGVVSAKSQGPFARNALQNGSRKDQSSNATKVRVPSRRGITQFLEPSHSNEDQEKTSHSREDSSSADKLLLASAVGNVPPGEQSDFALAQALQRQYDMQENKGTREIIGAGNPAAKRNGKSKSAAVARVPAFQAPNNCRNEDEEYAKQLQAKFDRENAQISRMEKLRSSVGGRSGGEQKRRRKDRSAARPISSFFGKK